MFIIKIIVFECIVFELMLNWEFCVLVIRKNNYLISLFGYRIYIWMFLNKFNLLKLINKIVRDFDFAFKVSLFKLGRRKLVWVWLILLIFRILVRMYVLVNLYIVEYYSLKILIKIKEEEC